MSQTGALGTHRAGEPLTRQGPQRRHGSVSTPTPRPLPSACRARHEPGTSLRSPLPESAESDTQRGACTRSCAASGGEDELPRSRTMEVQLPRQDLSGMPGWRGIARLGSSCTVVDYVSVGRARVGVAALVQRLADEVIAIPEWSPVGKPVPLSPAGFVLQAFCAVDILGDIDAVSGCIDTWARIDTKIGPETQDPGTLLLRRRLGRARPPRRRATTPVASEWVGSTRGQ